MEQWKVSVEEKFGPDDTIETSCYFNTKKEAMEFVDSLSGGNYGIWICKGTPLEDAPGEFDFCIEDEICLRSFIWYDSYYEDDCEDERLGIERDLDAEFDAFHLY